MSDHDLMVRAAWMYYTDDLTHAQIASKLQLSRVKVTRLLKRAREQGIVEIRVVHPMPPDLALSRQLEAAFPLGSAIVVPSSDAMGQAAANLLLYLLTPDMRIGFGWSSTVSRLADYLPPQTEACQCTVIDLVGNMIGKANPYSISGRVADVLGAALMPLAVPVLLSSPEAREALLSEPSIRQTLAAGQESHLAFIGVGEVGQTSTLVQTGFLSQADMQALQQQGVVGDMLMHCFNADGEVVHNTASERLLGIDWEALKQIPNVVLMAHGPHKVQALRGALRSGVPKTLITDMPTAQALLP
jgi:DNA-binding transcriptional regulator LsrR (DeoR family)